MPTFTKRQLAHLRDQLPEGAHVTDHPDHGLWCVLADGHVLSADGKGGTWFRTTDALLANYRAYSAAQGDGSAADVDAPTDVVELAAPTSLVVTPAPASVSPMIYDGDARRFVGSSSERRALAARLVERVRLGVVVQAVAVAQLHDEKLYLDMGFETWGEFCSVELDMTDRQARKLRAIAGQWQGLLAPGTGDVLGLGADAVRPSLPAAQQVNADALQGLGQDRLYALTTLPDVSYRDIVETGTVTLPDGSTVTLDEIQATSAKELAKQFSDQKKALRERAHVLEEQLATARAERDALKGAIETADERYKTAQTIERAYGPRATSVEAKRTSLDEARAALGRFTDLVRQAGVTVDDPDSIRDSCFHLLTQARSTVEALDADHLDLIEALTA